MSFLKSVTKMATKHQNDLDKDFVKGLYWAGIPTFFKCEQSSEPTKCDIALVGVPHSTGNGTTLRDQHLGPRAVRDISGLGRRVHLDFNLNPWQCCRIFDFGDVPLPEGNNNEASIKHITNYFVTLDRAETRTVAIGGDHSITGGILRAMGGKASKLSQGEPVALLHIDAHTDTFLHLEHFLGARQSAAHWGAQLVKEGHINANASTQIGIRGNPRSLDWYEPSIELGYKLITKQDYDTLGEAACCRVIRERIADKPVYITFDLDSLDASIAPGVANLEPGIPGFNMQQAIGLLRSVRGLNIIGGDVVCLMPTADNPNKVTAMVAMNIMFEILALITDYLQSQRNEL